MTQRELQPGSREKGSDSLKIHASVPQNVNFNALHHYRAGLSSSIRRLLAAAGISFPLVLGTAAVSEACGLEVGGTLQLSDASDAEITDGTATAEASWVPDANDANDVNDGDADSMDAVDSAKDSAIDTGLDAGPTATFSSAAGENECIHWLTADAGITKALASDNQICEPKPLAGMPINAGEDIYVWSKHNPSNNKVRFSTPINITTIVTRCSSYPNPPKKVEMEAELLGGGYIATSNAAVLPNVEVTNAGCTNGAAFVFHVAP